MSSELREAAKRALAARRDEGPSFRVRRAVFEVTTGNRTELVTATLDGPTLLCVGSDGRTDGPHVTAVLKFLAGLEGSRPAESEVRPREAPEPPRSGATTLPGVRLVTEPERPAAGNRPAVAEALADMVTAIVRVGSREATGSPSVEDAIERVLGAAPKPPPLGVARFIGRLRAALAGADVELLARLLEGAALVADDLRAADPPAEARLRIRSWLGPVKDERGVEETINERTLVEVGREWVSGLTRASIERRYLMDLEDGRLYREERAQGGAASVGPCPRMVHVGLGEVEGGPPPRRIRLLQYAISSEVDAASWGKVAAHALRRFAPIADQYRKALVSLPGLAEPFALVAPSKMEKEDGHRVPIDDEGAPLAIARVEDPSAAATLRTVADSGRLLWIAGRTVDAGGAVMILPVSAAVDAAGATELVRIR